MFEPTVETGFGYLERVQEFTGVAYGEAELILVHRLYLLRKEYADDPETRQVLDQVSLHLRNLETEQASLLLESIRPAAVSLPDDHSAGGAADILLFPNPVAEGRLNIRLDRIEGVNRMIISDIQGKVLYSAAPGPGNDLYCIDHLNLPGGVYLLTLYGGSGTSTVKFSVPD
jgi:hypothetical protein